MSAAQAQQAQIDQAQRQAAQAQAQAPSQSKKDKVQEIERLGNLKKQGLITDGVSEAQNANTLGHLIMNDKYMYVYIISLSK
jgi:hypothetical protein